jgi:hypothetical protein
MRIENYRKENKLEVIALLKTNILEYEEKVRVWDWQYEENPLIGDCCQGTVLIEEDRIVGFMGYMPVRVKYNGSELSAVWGRDFIMSPNFKGRGHGNKLVDSYRRTAPIALGLGSSDINAHLMTKYGYKANQEIEQYFFVRKPRCIRDLFKVVRQQVSLSKFSILRQDFSGLEVNVVDVSLISDDLDLLWREVESGYVKVVKRGCSYIKWKYGSHPSRRYQSILVRSSGKLVAMGIIRESIDDVSRLVDYVGPASAPVVKRLLIEVFKTSCARSHLLECTSTDKEFKKALESLGFRKYKQRPRFHVYSSLVSEPQENWFVMGGDSDNDF